MGGEEQRRKSEMVNGVQGCFSTQLTGYNDCTVQITGEQE